MRTSSFLVAAVAALGAACSGTTTPATDTGALYDTDATLHPATIWYTDADGDGYGALASPTQACSQPQGAVANADDCDDTAPYADDAGAATGAVYAWYGPLGSGSTTAASADLQIDGDATYSLLGGGAPELGDANGDGVLDLTVGTPDMASSGGYESAGSIGLFYGNAL